MTRRGAGPGTAGPDRARGLRTTPPGGTASVLLVAAMLAAGCGGEGQGEGASRFRPLLAGDAVPAYAAVDLVGDTVHLADLRGEVVVLNLWATWCPPCRRELPMLAAAARTYPDVRFVFAAQAEPRATVARYLEEEGLELDLVLLDTRGSLGAAFGSVGLPTTLFFDAAGDHVLTHFGEVSSVAMINYLADLRRGTL